MLYVKTKLLTNNKPQLTHYAIVIAIETVKKLCRKCQKENYEKIVKTEKNT